jgi:RND family efflux transporter MFP subunit
MTRTARFLVLGAAAIGAALLIAVASNPGPEHVQSGDPAARPVAVQVDRVLRGAIAGNVTAIGTIAAHRDVTVSSETAGRVVRVLANVGDQVRQGQPLVLVDRELKDIAVDQAKAGVLAAETNLQKAKKDYERAEKLFSTGDIADIELEAYRLGYRSADAQHKGALVGLRAAERQLSDTRITSPINGTVAARFVELGEMVSPGRPIANVVDLSSLKVKLSIAEEDISRLRIRQSATLRVDGVPGGTFRGAVATIGAKSESPSGHTYPIEVVVDNRMKSPLKAGMFARVEILVESDANALTVSKEAVVNEDVQPAVYVIEGNVARLRTVQLGIRACERYQITNGLREGEVIVSFGHNGLKDGSPVKVK